MYNQAVNNNYYRQKRKRMNIFKLFIYIALFSSIILVCFAFTTFSNKPIEYIEVEVKAGDSLWTIAERYSTDEVDLRKLVYKIKKINKLENPILQPGQIIKMPEPG